MRSVMIVDDESLVRIGLQSIIDWERHGYKITGVYKNGEEALAAAAKQPFDVVLTDIRMPGMDGFELIRELKRVDPDAQVIVLSSYNDFEYTRQAIRLGVKDYISKYEMEPDELLRVLASLPLGTRQPRRDESAALRGAGPESDEDAELAEEARRLLEAGADAEAEGAVDGAADGARGDNAAGGEAPAYPRLASRLGDFGGAFRWVALAPHPREPGYSAAERKAMRHLADEMFARLRNPVLFGEAERAGGSGFCLHGAFAFDPASAPEANRDECRRLAEEWTAAFATKLNVALAVGFAPPAATHGGWRAARAEAELAARASLFGGGGIRFRETCGEQGLFGEEEWLGLYKHTKMRIRYMQFGLLADELAAMLGEKLNRYAPAEWIRLGVAVSSQLADFVIERYDPEPAELRDAFGALWPFAEAAGAVRTADEWRRVVREIATRTQDIAARRQARGGWLERVKAHMEAHYGEPIRLEEMAQLANFSENHFSQRFRQETGEAFSDYLTALRIREAVRMLRDTALSTEEIAARVGYANPNYFVKVFKKVTGQTITGFKGGGRPER